jgi:hypothetical protein
MNADRQAWHVCKQGSLVAHDADMWWLAAFGSFCAVYAYTVNTTDDKLKVGRGMHLS